MIDKIAKILFIILIIIVLISIIIINEITKIDISVVGIDLSNNDIFVKTKIQNNSFFHGYIRVNYRFKIYDLNSNLIAESESYNGLQLDKLVNYYLIKIKDIDTQKLALELLNNGIVIYELELSKFGFRYKYKDKLILDLNDVLNEL